MKLSELAAHLDCPFTGEPDREIIGVAALDQAGPDQLSFVEDIRRLSQVKQTQAGALLVPDNAQVLALVEERSIPCLRTRTPRLLFAQALNLFYKPFQPTAVIHPTAVIDSSVSLGRDVAIGANVVIQPGVVVGDQVCIHPNVTIYPDVRIGDRTLLHANCVIHERTQIGADCVIHSGAVLGAEGFGFVPTPQGTWFKMPQSGSVVVEDEVEIGCNSNVDRPAVGETRIGRGCKLDNLVQVGHGCKIGAHCVIAAQTGLAGASELGDHVVLAAQSGVANQAKVGSRVTAGARAGIMSDVDPGAIVAGYPAIPNTVWLRAVAVYRRLPEIYQTLRQLQRQIDSRQ
ncbi:UDP-3-O-(3-hydroxymyristoyl)glucosamine N-acyltransferase [Leptolyngbya sp. FACHB-261]|uniref:UDP-3-O-(3-hydroxymyristoyl)glucosamine N-acyltransferase n=1 Tax=Leptolyngbya sp. FACHB-261 TaxID=2692806 RepID=UPI001682F80A|nr:UDP-3-O-(3-hydroxymyristoyl)glucosamine N-acyltransferase [Leptolyngbya sp. FACHB-261]MBD2099509.1 UDP-3-O-(3-hydroxymyristoyl)glucosamine N-acyltransferase [Leptolyngbya sp. FACHB-261]